MSSLALESEPGSEIWLEGRTWCHFVVRPTAVLRPRSRGKLVQGTGFKSSSAVAGAAAMITAACRWSHRCSVRRTLRKRISGYRDARAGGHRDIVALESRQEPESE